MAMADLRKFGLLAILALLQLASAQIGRQANPQVTPAAHLVLRQQDICDLGNTVCPDRMGCCPSTARCDYASYDAILTKVPICDVKCDAMSVTCGGPYSGLCCPSGSSCNAQNSGVCTNTKFPPGGPPPPPPPPPFLTNPGGPFMSSPGSFSQSLTFENPLPTIPSSVSGAPEQSRPTAAVTVEQPQSTGAANTASRSGNAAPLWTAGPVQYALVGLGGLLAAL